MNLVVDRDSLKAMQRLAVLHVCALCGRIFNRAELEAVRCPFCGDDQIEECA